MSARGQTGSALALALWAAGVVALLGAAFLIGTATESHIPSNQAAAARAAHAAEAGARAAKGWLDRPWDALGLPPPGAVVRAREILDETDPLGPGTVPGPQYKQGVDRDADLADDLFQPPYRGTAADAFLGRADAPDVRVTDTGYLDGLSAILLGPATDGLRPRITEIALYAPPYVHGPAGWRRQGIATVAVRAVVERAADPGAGPLAAAGVELVLGEIPYAAELRGPLHSCADLSVAGALRVHAGAACAVGAVFAPDGLVFAASLPRRPAADPRIDLLWTDDPAWIAEFDAKIGIGQEIPDPWSRLLAGGSIEGAPPGVAQPFAGPGVPAPGTPGPWSCCDGSNVFQGQPNVPCPSYPYETWKAVAVSGEAGMHYYAWCGGAYCRDGAGPARSVQEHLAASAGRDAVHFFDTVDGRAPLDDDADGVPDNLAPPVELGPGWLGRGLVYLNASRVEAIDLGLAGAAEIAAPAEVAGAGGAAWIDLIYPATPGAPIVAAGPGPFDAGGPVLSVPASYHGVVVVAGAFRAVGRQAWVGSVVAHGGIELEASAAGEAPAFHWDAALTVAWPPRSWRLPRTAVVSLRREP